ncbi:hypothetical protein SEA_EVY_102 [Streptomyces phage Evy]|uniref:Uncharacterized protein n=3 Tax=Samistivirus TaxID=2560220 RepID=A0A221SAZ7_9CAUD|nr:hypothetical protein AXJ18_gp172 [Streptomyces phage Jay2Jay]YP_010103476.1 hypothetical protein KNU67_gp165 [Streptomyces phage Evy]ASN73177.1 hypothetical protein SEA_WARPY_106 [Streptomyces phage Warpy]UEM46888.1 hypothetical protein SEA_TARGARYEN_103 [Streptomyces phage Targaryen]AIW02602.1 hypothetical protein PBI_JAY2JAY_107 [Streptomyces phage Jay2Jay]QDH93967.1 hypothetical protein SEA_EVY_102 [Streptomyces phage Evy]
MALTGRNGQCWFQKCTRKATTTIRYHNKSVVVCDGHKNLDGVGCPSSRRRPKS